MMSIHSYWETFHEFLFGGRVREKWLFQNHFVLPTIVIAYVLTSVWLGPLFMKKRKPYNIKPIIIIYDLVQVFINAHIFIQLAPLAFTLDRNFHCGFDKTEVVKIVEMGYEVPIWHLLLLKHFDFLDTIFFILRKKFSHVTALHVIHHAVVAFGVFYIACIDNNLISFLPAVILNTGVHAIMYAYYGSSVIGLGIAMKYKNIVTIVQIIQFVMMVSYVSVLYLSGCIPISTSSIMLYVFILYLLIMFIRIYVDQYLKTRPSSMKES